MDKKNEYTDIEKAVWALRQLIDGSRRALQLHSDLEMGKIPPEDYTIAQMAYDMNECRKFAEIARVFIKRSQK